MVRFNQNYNREEVIVSPEDSRRGIGVIFAVCMAAGLIALLTNILVTIARYDKLHGIYRYTAFFYNCVLIQPIAGFEIALDWLTVHSPLPWVNLNLVLALVVLLAPPIGLFIFLKRKKWLKYVLGVLCLPAVVMVIYYLGSTAINWLFV